MTKLLDTSDRRILDLIQRGFPLVSRPFGVVAEQTGASESDVIERLARLKQAGIVREICAVFDSRQVGYHSTLAAMAVEPKRLEEVAAIVSAHPGVSHNYERMHRFNLWFTLTVAADRSIEEEVARLACQAQIADFLVLPAIRRFKIGVDLDLGTREGDQPSAISGRQSGASDPQSAIQNPKSEVRDRKSELLSDAEKNVVRVLQHDLPLEPRPFERLAVGIGMSEDEMLAIAKRFSATGVMRRIGAILRHRNVGYLANAMVCWRLGPERVEKAGGRAARERAVSHCYERPSFPPRWPYNLMTMIHGRSEAEVGEVVERLRAAIEPLDYAILLSGREFKKKRAYYFETA
jgi:DNA-binding Lrp family transcriptional regulator